MIFRYAGALRFLLLLYLIFPPHAPLCVVVAVVNDEYDYACRPAHGSFPFCDTARTVEERVYDLISRLELQEKIILLGSAAPAIPRLGIPAYNWWQEALHGVADDHGVDFNGPIKTATSFPQPILTAASFNDTLFQVIAQVVSTEARAMYNTGQSGLTFWSPNVNIFRDPRWGRGQETPGEDPTLSSNYAAAFVRGMQDIIVQEEEATTGTVTSAPAAAGARKLKTSSCCKHFSAYDLECWGGADRDHFDAIVTVQDMEDTYNPPFRSCVQGGRASGIMCSYNRVNGVPMCGSHRFLSETVRHEWGLEGYIVSDCDAVYDMTNEPPFSQTLETAVADSLLAGLDLNCGITFRDHAEVALRRGLMQETHLDEALRNLFTVQMWLGLFDGDPSAQMFGTLGPNDVCTPDHQALALDAALQGIVLLKNENNSLPLSRKIQSLAVLGPSAKDGENRMLGSYAGFPCVYVTPADGLAEYIRDLRYESGCSDPSCTENDFSDASSAAAEADAVVLVVGLDQGQEREQWDRTNLLLPGNQPEFISSIAKVAKGPVVLVIISGGPVDVSFAKDDPLISSILWAGYPGQAGGQAIAKIIFGDSSPSGKLPMTWYPESFAKKVPMTDMNMRPNSSTGYPGRSHRFYTQETVFPFGHGLSYSTFKQTVLSAPTSISIPLNLWDLQTRHHTTQRVGAEFDNAIQYTEQDSQICSDITFQVEVLVENEGSRSGSNVVLLYSIPPGSGKDGVVLKNLMTYQRVHLGAGENCKVTFVVQPCKHLSTVKTNGKQSLDAGDHVLSLGGDVRHHTVQIMAGASVEPNVKTSDSLAFE